ncbi:MAG: FAD-binding monooxygenase [Nocardia sp.]|uniref:FAD-dependent monooxygenase n=1 Tax=Nocardia sp. TaxID=1821 RepID=UPI0026313A3F|nr:FAD-dependent monooxygenase [Nocardia sp.]MCU1647258.1 FAD-binding monooxygenase [Nocardia sp.]
MSTDTNLRILIAGGGIAGNAVALQLVRAGIATTVVERATAPRPGGQAVDLRGPSREVAERMGLMDGIRKHQLHEKGMVQVDADGATIYEMPMEMFEGHGAIAEVEISRGDLNGVLLTELAGAAGELDYRYGEWIETLDQDGTGVTVGFASGLSERYDLVIGADGVHSGTRKLAFGPEEQFTTYLGGYMSFYTIPTPDAAVPDWMAMHVVPRASVGVRSDADPATSKAILTFRIDADPALRRDTEAQQQLVRSMVAGTGWCEPEVLAGLDAATDFYFDELVRVDMPSLSAGRITLLGDAGYCGSPLTGMGTAMAIVGAYLLAGEIAATPGDITGALARYEAAVTPFLEKAKTLPGGGLKMMIPTSKVGLKVLVRVGKLMMSRPFRPIMTKMLDTTEDYVLPSY